MSMIKYQAMATIRRQRTNNPDASELNYKNVGLLGQYIDSTGKINGRRQTGLDAKKQRTMQKAIKQARALGLLPYNV